MKIQPTTTIIIIITIVIIVINLIIIIIINLIIISERSTLADLIRTQSAAFTFVPHNRAIETFFFFLFVCLASESKQRGSMSRQDRVAEFQPQHNPDKALAPSHVLH